MTISEETVRYVYAGPYSIGDTAPIPFTYAEKEHVKVAINTDLQEAEVDYSVSGQNIILNVALDASQKLVIYRDTPLDNEAEFPQEAAFDSEKINDAIDKLTMQNQEQEEELSRALKLDIDASTAIKDLTLPTPEPNKGLKWNETATGLVNTKYDPDEMAQRAEEAAQRAEYWAGQTQDVSGVAEDAIEAMNEASKYATWAGQWAVGSPSEPAQGSAKFWAQQANAVVSQGFSYFTQDEWDALSTSQKQGILLAFVLGE